MDKGYILVDKIPCNCYECDNHNYHFCSWTGDCIEDYLNVEARPDSCPIRMFPEKMKYHKGVFNGQVKGWNLCLEKIIKQAQIKE